jgi:hypothetical protein
VPRRDRLLGLSTCRLALRQAVLATPEAVLAAPPELRRRYRHCFGDALRLVAYRIDDGGEGEREAWRALVATLRASS